MGNPDRVVKGEKKCRGVPWTGWVQPGGLSNPDGSPINLEARWLARLTAYSRLELMAIEAEYLGCSDCAHAPGGSLRESHATAAIVARRRLNEMARVPRPGIILVDEEENR
jgi:hypothetical protein